MKTEGFEKYIRRLPAPLEFYRPDMGTLEMG